MGIFRLVRVGNYIKRVGWDIGAAVYDYGKTV